MDINKLMKQAQDMQRQLEDANKQITAMEFEGNASNGLVKVKVNGDYKILKVEIQKEIISPDDKEMIEDLIMIATNEAITKADEAKKKKFGSMANSIGLPKI